MRLLYAFPEPLPLERARGLQVVHTVAALGRAGVDVTLAFAPVRGPGGAADPHVDPFVHYGIARPPGVTIAAVPRALPWPFSGVHSNRLYFANLRRRFGKELEAGPVFVRHLKLAANLARQLPGARFVSFGHLGDGNIHYNVSQPIGMDKHKFLDMWNGMNDVVFEVVGRFNGSISAEHGIGRLKAHRMPDIKSPVELDMMRGLKRMLDPNSILNPGRVLPE